MRDRQLKPALVLAAILAAALAIRLATGLWWQSRLPAGDKFGFGDSDSYWALGRAIARGEPYQYGSPDLQVFRTPGYPLLLAPLFWLGGNDPPVEWAYALSAVLGTAAVGGVYWLGRMLFDQRTGLVAAAIVTVYPGAISQGALVLSEAPFTLAMLIQFGLWMKAVGQASGLRSGATGSASVCATRTRPASGAPAEPVAPVQSCPREVASISHLGFAASAGVFAAIATLIRPSWLLFTPFAIAFAIAFFPPRRRQLLIGVVMLAGFALGLLPWWIRNWHVTGHFVATTLQTGASLYDGLNPHTDGGSNMLFVERFTAEQRAADAVNPPPPGSDSFEYRLNKTMQRAALDWAKSNPGRVVQLAAIKFLRMWNCWPNERGLSSWPLRILVAVTYLPLLLYGIFGAIKFTRRGFAYTLCWLPAIYFTSLHMIFVGSIRYREPAMIALAALAAGAICVRRSSNDSLRLSNNRPLPTDY
jgi:4-amino-4-deoxy-L-arabinose transferase-like glycosyltransferase